MTKDIAIQAANAVLKARVALDIAADIFKRLHFFDLVKTMTLRAQALDVARAALEAATIDNNSDFVLVVDGEEYVPLEGDGCIPLEENVPF